MIANYVDFGIAFRKARADYDRYIRNRPRAVFAQTDPNIAEVPDRDENLEVHIRTYVIDPLLEALNWQNGKNIVIEAFLRDQFTNTRRRLDYLGHERDAVYPLLIVEAKRPNAPFIDVTQSLQPGRNYIYSETQLLADALHYLKDSQQPKVPLLKVWSDWLSDVRTYCLNTHNNTGRMPQRVVITNGAWLIIFKDPEDAFCGDARPAESEIFLFRSVKRIEDSRRLVFELLDYNRIAAFNRPISPAEISVHFAVEEFEVGINALQVSYSDVAAGYCAIPTVNVIPEIFLRHRRGGWIRVTSGRPDPLPHRPRDLDQHLADVAAVHATLMGQVEAAVQHRVPILSIEEHYKRHLHVELPGVRSNGTDRFLVLTGNQSHFIKHRSDFEQCRYHWLHLAAADGQAPSNIPPSVSTSPRTHFGSNAETAHCSHATVQTLKSVQIGADNRRRYPPRDGAEDGPFCKLWGFETFLCCRRCVFQPVCGQAVGAMMPCRPDKGAGA
jgi:hypothetical protein